MDLNGKNLSSDEMWISDYDNLSTFGIKQTQRIGVEYAKEDKKLPWRFYIRDNKFVSVK